MFEEKVIMAYIFLSHHITAIFLKFIKTKMHKIKKNIFVSYKVKTNFWKYFLSQLKDK